MHRWPHPESPQSTFCDSLILAPSLALSVDGTREARALHGSRATAHRHRPQPTLEGTQRTLYSVFSQPQRHGLRGPQGRCRE
eukprot:1877585-Prymnesium_polylepis.2